MTSAAINVSHGCPYPGCTLDNEHDGDHRIARPQVPAGELRLLQKFEGCTFVNYCDLNPDELHRDHLVAEAFYVDELGFGWALCRNCIKSISATGSPPDKSKRGERGSDNVEVSHRRREKCVKPSPRETRPLAGGAEKPAEALPPQPAPVKSKVIEMRRPR
jgi:hypothetical protein